MIDYPDDPCLVLPHNLDAEKAVLGSLLIDPQAAPIVDALLKPHDFYSTPHQRVYEAIRTLAAAEKPFDMMSLYDELRKVEQIEEIGGLAYLTTLEGCVMSTANVAHHAQIVRDKFELRNLITTARETLDAAYREEQPADQIQQQAFQKILDRIVRSSAASKAFQPVAESLPAVVDHIERIRSDGKDFSGLSTHFEHLDELLLGFAPGDFIILAARPRMGKTALAGNIAQNIALLGQTKDNPRHIGFFSIEMAHEQILTRMLSAAARVDSLDIRGGYITETQLAAIKAKADILVGAPIHIDDTPGLMIDDLCARAHRLKTEYPDLALIIVDYIQKVRGSERSARGGKLAEVTEISDKLKTLARRLEIPVLALSQMSRSIEQRSQKRYDRPKLSDLRESGALEQDADTVLFLHWDPDKAEKEAPAKGTPPPEDFDPDKDGFWPPPVGVKLIIAKQKNGPAGDIQLSFARQFTQFLTLPRERWREDEGADKPGGGSVHEKYPPKAHIEIIQALEKFGRLKGSDLMREVRALCDDNNNPVSERHVRRIIHDFLAAGKITKDTEDFFILPPEEPATDAGETSDELPFEGINPGQSGQEGQ